MKDIKATCYVRPDEITNLEPAWSDDEHYLISWRRRYPDRPIEYGFVPASDLAPLVFAEWRA